MALAHGSCADPNRPPAAKAGPVHTHIQIVSADPGRARAAWHQILRRKRYAVTVTAFDHPSGTQECEPFPDAILLDLADRPVEAMLLCRQLRSEGITSPVLMLDPLGTPEDLHAGLQAGADAYLRGWFEPQELLERLEALLRANAGYSRADPDSPAPHA